MMRQFHIYITSSPSKTLYTGVTSILPKRIEQHRQKVTGFTAKYNITRQVFAEETNDPRAAIVREKQIKGMSRAKKIAFIESANPGWVDLSENWFAWSEDK